MKCGSQCISIASLRAHVLTTATPTHLALIRSIVEEGAHQGSFSRALATTSVSTEAFFEKLRWSLQTGHLPQFDPRTRAIIVTRVTGYVFSEREKSANIGFGIFRDFFEDGNELWLTGLRSEHHGFGLGRAMLAELLDTPPGRATQLARCTSHSSGAQRCSHVLKTLGFSTCRIANDEEWLLHRRTPAPVVAMLAHSTMVRMPQQAPRAGVHSAQSKS
jgi:hypothetical protein